MSAFWSSLFTHTGTRQPPDAAAAAAGGAMLGLPDELLELILSHAAVPDVLRFSTVSRRCRAVGTANSLWRVLVHREFGEPAPPDAPNLRRYFAERCRFRFGRYRAEALRLVQAGTAVECHTPLGFSGAQMHTPMEHDSVVECQVRACPSDRAAGPSYAHPLFLNHFCGGGGGGGGGV